MMIKRSVKSPGLISERVQRGNTNHPRPEPIVAALHTSWSGDIASCTGAQEQGQSNYGHKVLKIFTPFYFSLFENIPLVLIPIGK